MTTSTTPRWLHAALPVAVLAGCLTLPTGSCYPHPGS